MADELSSGGTKCLNQTKSSQEEESLIAISILGENKGLIWDSDDVLKLRKNYRITGCFVGSLPRKPWQNTALSIPLLLMPEEATLLLQKGTARIIQQDESPRNPLRSTVEEFKNHRQNLHHQQIEIFVAEREEKRQCFYDLNLNPGEGKRNRKRKQKFDLLEESDYDNADSHTKEKKALISNLHEEWPVVMRQEQNDATKTQESIVLDVCEDVSEKKSAEYFTIKEKVATENSVFNEQSLDKSKLLNCTAVKDSKGSISNIDLQYYDQSTWIHIPTSSPNYQQINLKKTSNWEYPKTDKEKLNFKVFCDLWEKGYHITSGEKFGCDYLVYPGDPLRFHSYFMIIVVESGKALSALELLAYGRLGTSVKKTIVIACEDVSSDECYVKYQSLLWAGIN